MLLVIMLVIAGVMSIMEFRKVSSWVDTVMDNNYKSVEQTKLMLDAIEREDSGVLMFLMGNKDESIKIISSADSVMKTAIHIAENNITEANEDKYIQRVIDEYANFYGSIKKTIEANSISSLQEKNNAYFLENQKHFFSTKEAVNALMKLNEDSIFKQTTDMKENAKRAIMPGIVSIVAAIIFALLLNFFISEYFISPIRQLKDAVSSFYPEQYNLKVNIRSKDELKGLETEINNLIHRLLNNNHTDIQ